VTDAVPAGGRLARARRGFRRHRPIASAAAVAVVTLGAIGFVRHARLTVPYLLIVLGGAVFVAIADDRARFSTLTIAGLAVWAALHLAGGLIELDDGRILYNVTLTRWIHFDNVVHFIGFGSAGMASCEALRASVGVPLRRGTAWTVTWLAAQGIGAVNEVVEFAATHPLNATGVGGYQNTGRDLVANLLGGAAAGLWMTRRADVVTPLRQL